MNTRKGLWAVVNRGTLNLAAHQVDGEYSGLPAIFRTRKMAREYIRKEHGVQAHLAQIEKVTVTEEK